MNLYEHANKLMHKGSDGGEAFKRAMLPKIEAGYRADSQADDLRYSPGWYAETAFQSGVSKELILALIALCA